MTCELALDDEGEYYELRTLAPFSDSTGIERFSSVAKAFERQSEIEARLIAEGWTLESHECVLT